MVFKSKRRISKSRGGGSRKRPLNNFFKAMLKAKRAGAQSFKYNGKLYKGRKHERLGMIYKRA